MVKKTEKTSPEAEAPVDGETQEQPSEAMDTAEARADVGTDIEPESEAPVVAEGASAPAPSAAEQEVAVLRDQLLRLAADFDNYRKRSRKEQEEARKYGLGNVLLDVLPVLDNLERALAHAEGDKHPIVQGVRLVAKQFLDVLGRHGVVTFQAQGAAFDPERHEAVSQLPSADAKPGTVLEELQRGYMLQDRLLRPAKVVVSTAAPSDAPSDHA